ncbi:MAG TPA: FAD-dependent monooxygenase, partial [Novosphingobium sp.]|nr:FAD-dependent monooxygenase [Novosphingobium sp.]
PPPRPPAPHALPPIGVFRPVFAQVMEEHAQRLGATLRKGLTVDHIADEAGAARVTLSNGEIRRYDCVIGADGVHSRVRALLFPEARAPQYAGQMSVRWMIPGPAIPGEGWYVAAGGRLGFFHMARQNVVYAPIVFTMPDEYVTQEAAYARVKALLDEFTAPAIVNLRQYLRPDSTFICRPWRWHLVDAPWYRGRTLLIGDAAHSTTSHMGMGAGIALEDAVVLAQCIAAAPSLEQAYAAFMQRRFERVEVVAMSSLNLSRMEQAGAPEAEVAALRSQAFAKIAQPY